MTIVVTGGAGHLGVNLVRELIGRGETVRALVYRKGDELAALGAELVRGSVCEPDTLASAFAGATKVFHLAGVISIDGDPDGSVWRVNVEGTANVARACLEVGARMINVSSVHAFAQRPFDAVLDEGRSLVGDSDEHSVYDRSKAAGERAVAEAVAAGLDAVTVNPTGIMGPADPGPSRLGRLLLDLAARRLPALLEGGVDFVDVRDVVAGTIAAGERGRRGEGYILAGAWYSIAELAAIASEVTGVAAPKLVTPIWTARLGVPFAKLLARATKREPLVTHESLDVLVSHRSISSAKARAELGFRARPLRETVGDSYRWFAEQGRLRGRAAARVLA